MHDRFYMVNAIYCGLILYLDFIQRGVKGCLIPLQ